MFDFTDIAASETLRMQFILAEMKKIVGFAGDDGGATFGGYVRDVVVPEMQGMKIEHIPDYVSLYFETTTASSAFLQQCHALGYTLSHDTSLTERSIGCQKVTYNVSRDEEYLFAVDVVVGPKLVVDDFDVNVVKFVRRDNKWVCVSDYDLVERIGEKKATMLPSYAPYQRKDKFYRIKSDFFDKGWKVYYTGWNIYYCDRFGTSELPPNVSYEQFCDIFRPTTCPTLLVPDGGKSTDPSKKGICSPLANEQTVANVKIIKNERKAAKMAARQATTKDVFSGENETQRKERLKRVIVTLTARLGRFKATLTKLEGEVQQETKQVEPVVKILKKPSMRDSLLRAMNTKEVKMQRIASLKVVIDSVVSRIAQKTATLEKLDKLEKVSSEVADAQFWTEYYDNKYETQKKIRDDQQSATSLESDKKELEMYTLRVKFLTEAIKRRSVNTVDIQMSDLARENAALKARLAALETNKSDDDEMPPLE